MPLGNYVDIKPFFNMKRLAVDTDGSGDGDTLVAAIAGKRIAVNGAFLMPDGEVTLQFLSGDPSGSPASLTGEMNLAAAGNGFVLTPQPSGYHWFETLPGEALSIALSDEVTIAGVLLYHVLD